MPTKRVTSSQKKRNEGLKKARLRIGSMTPDSGRRSRSHSGRLAALKRDMQAERFRAYLKRHPSYEEKRKAKSATKKTSTKKAVTKKAVTKKTATKKTATKKTATKGVSKKRNTNTRNPYTQKRRAAPVVTERGNEDNLTILVRPKNMDTLGEQLKNKGFIEIRTTRAGTLFKHPAMDRIKNKVAVSDADIDKIAAQMNAITGIGKVEQQIKKINKEQKIDNSDFNDLIGNLEGVKLAADSADELTTMMASLRA
jgi:hypothetical protein